MDRAKQNLLYEILQWAKVSVEVLPQEVAARMARPILNEMTLILDEEKSTPGEGCTNANGDSLIAAFAGQFSAGKSSIINKLITHDTTKKGFLPVGLDETTAVPTIVTPGKTERRLLLKVAGGGWTPVNTAMEESFFNAKESMIGSIDPIFKRMILSGYPVCVQTSHLNQRLRNWRFLDTPGLSSGHTAGQEDPWEDPELPDHIEAMKTAKDIAPDSLSMLYDLVTTGGTGIFDFIYPWVNMGSIVFKYLPWFRHSRPDIVFYVVDIGHGLQETDMKALQLIRFGLDIHVVVLLNKADKLPPSRRKEPLDYTKTGLKKYSLGKTPVFTVICKDDTSIQQVRDLLNKNREFLHERRIKRFLMDFLAMQYVFSSNQKSKGNDCIARCQSEGFDRLWKELKFRGMIQN